MKSTPKVFHIALSSLFLAATAPSVHAKIMVNDVTLPAETWHVSVMPGETVEFKETEGLSIFVGEELITGSWTAPQISGQENLITKDAAGNTIGRVTLFILTPSSEISEKGYIGKYRIGIYPRNTPKGFIKLEEGDVSLPVSPHFRVGQFLCKQQPSVWPKYLVVSSDNLVRLETLLDDLNEKRDTQADTLFVMSGYRTPFYNSAIGSAKFSRHMYGDAADVYVDSKPRNGNMDDLNRDGKVTKADANFMYDYAVKLFDEKNVVKGGLGSYKANAVHGPFLHVDARGRPARWGRSPKPKSP